MTGVYIISVLIVASAANVLILRRIFRPLRDEVATLRRRYRDDVNAHERLLAYTRALLATGPKKNEPGKYVRLGKAQWRELVEVIRQEGE